MNMNSLIRIGCALALAVSVGCGGAMIPSELGSARSSYDRATRGPAATLNPTDLHTAKESLDRAEKSFDENGGSQETKDLAYAAQCDAEVAESRARAMQSRQDKEKILAQIQAAQVAAGQLTTAQLGKANQQLASQGQQLASKDQALQSQGMALQTETQRRIDAEKRAAQASADLAKFATVKQEPRGMVITLSGSVLFASAKWELLPSAQAKLTDVAGALIKESPESKIVVEGHTDSQGGVDFNQDLSQKRADAVRTYLVSKGIASDRIAAQGFGLSRSIADNNSPEGRANNRRVEIVVQPAARQ
jgi:outer membrane protein OmpA-like peptidoglycan-associated protein